MVLMSEQREARLQIRMRPTERQRLRELAAQEGRTSSEVVRALVRQAAERRRGAIDARLCGSVDESPDEAA